MIKNIGTFKNFSDGTLKTVFDIGYKKIIANLNLLIKLFIK